MGLCWITSDGTTGFLSDELDDALITEHVAETKHMTVSLTYLS